MSEAISGISSAQSFIVSSGSMVYFDATEFNEQNFPSPFPVASGKHYAEVKVCELPKVVPFYMLMSNQSISASSGFGITGTRFRHFSIGDNQLFGADSDDGNWYRNTLVIRADGVYQTYECELKNGSYTYQGGMFSFVYWIYC